MSESREGESHFAQAENLKQALANLEGDLESSKTLTIDQAQENLIEMVGNDENVDIRKIFENLFAGVDGNMDFNEKDDEGNFAHQTERDSLVEELEVEISSLESSAA